MKDSAPVVHNVVTLQFGVQQSMTSSIVTTVLDLSCRSLSSRVVGRTENVA